MDYISNHKLIVGLIVVVLIGAAWYEFTQSSTPAPLLSSTAATTGGDTNPADQTLVSTLLALQAVSLNGTIFSDPAFLSLKDFTTQIVSEPVGRPNPFAPLSPSALQSVPSTPTNPNLFAPAKQ